MSRAARTRAGARSRADQPVVPGSAPTGRWAVSTGTAEVLADDDQPGAWMLLVDDVPQSSVDPSAPLAVGFDYVRTLADVVDVMAPAGFPLTVAHLGAGALSLARYVAAARPRSRQLAVEVDAALAALVRERFGVPAGTRLRIEDALVTVSGLRAASYDLVVDDAFVAGVAPSRLGGVAAVRAIAAALAPGGLFAANVSSGPAAAEQVRRRLAAILEVFPSVCVSGPPRVVKGRTEGNVVVVAGLQAVPADRLTAVLARRSRPLRLLEVDEVRAWAAGAAPLP